MPQEEVTTEEAAQLLGCSPRTVRNLIARGTLPARRERFDPTSKGVYKIKIFEVEKLIKALQQSSS